MNPVDKNSKVVVALNLPTAQMPLATNGQKYANPFKIKLTVDDGKTLQNFDFLKNTAKGSFEHRVKRGTKIVVKIEGAEVFSPNNPAGKKLFLKRIDNDLIFETEAGEKLVQLNDYYLAPDVELDSPNWIEIVSDTPTSSLNAAVDYLTGETTALPLDFLAYYSLGLLGVGAVGGFLLNQKKKNNATAAAPDTLKVIQNFAADIANTAEPTLANYKAADIAGVITEADKTQVNSFLIEANIDPSTKVAIEAIAAAANRVEAYAASNSNSVPTLTDYQTLGVLGSDGTAQQVSLLNNAVDGKVGTGVDSFTELNLLAAAVRVVQGEANGVRAPSPSVLLAALNTLGVTTATTDNIATIATDLAKAKAAGVDTLTELNAVVAEAAKTAAADAAAALSKIVNFSKEVLNFTAPSPDVFLSANIAGVTTVDDAAQVNSFLALLDNDPDSFATIQSVVAASNKVEAYAANPTSTVPVLADYQVLGILAATPTGTVQQASLLSSVVDNKVASDVDSAPELMLLADAVKVVQDAADGGTLPTNTALLAALQTLGITSATANNIAPVAAAVATAAAAGSDTIAKLNAIATTAAAKVLQDAAQSILTSYAADTVGATVPVLVNYQSANILGVTTEADATQVNTFLALAAIDPATKATVDAIAAAANKVEAYAASSTNPPPTLADYQTLGILSTAGTPAQTNLLNSTVDRKTPQEVDSAPELQAFADAVTVVQDAADGGTAPTNATLLAALQTLGISGANATNIALIAAALAAATTTTAGADTLAELEAISLAATNQLAQDASQLVITTFAADPVAPVVPVAPTLANYIGAKIAEVSTAADATQVNSFLALPDIDPTTKAAVDAIAAAANKVEAYAASSANPAPTLADYQALGVLSAAPTGTEAQAILLNSAVDRKAAVDVDSATELKALADAAKVVLDVTDGGNAPTAQDLLAALQTLGVTGVTANNINPIAAVMAASNAAGTDTVAELETIAANAANQSTQDAALTLLTTYAADTANAAVPALVNYQAANIAGLTNNADALQVNSFLALANIDPTTKADIEAVAAAANKVEAYAASNTSAAPVLGDYQILGILASSATANEVNLLNSAVDGKLGADVDSAEKLVAIAAAAKVVQDAADGTPVPTFTVLLAALQTLGVTGANTNNIADMAAAIAAANVGGTDSIAELNVFAATANLALQNAAQAVINTYAADTVGATVPALGNYQAANIAGVATEADATQVNTFLSLAAIDPATKADVETIAAAANKVEAYAESITNQAPTLADYQALGVLAASAASPAGTTAQANLLNSVVDGKQGVDVDSATELMNLATAVKVVQDAADGGTLPTNAALQAALQTLGITSVTSDNIAEVATGIAAGTTAGADSLSELSTIVTTVNSTVPTVSSITLTATGAQAGSLNLGDTVTATVTMSEVTTVTGTPQLALNIGGSVVQANYASGSGTTALVFTYAILANQTDANGISLGANALSLNSGSLKDASSNNANLTTAAIADNVNFKVDTTAAAAPSISRVIDDVGNVTTDVASGGTTDDTDLVIRVSLANTNAALGDTVQLNNGSTALGNAVTLTATNITDAYVDITSTALTNATTYAFNAKITDVAGNVSLASANHNVTIDTAPTVSSLAITSATNAPNGILNAGDVVTVTVNMSEATTVTGTPQLALNIGGTTVQATYAGGTGTTALTFNYTILANQTDANGISLDANALSQINGSTLRDSFGSDATLATPVVADNANFKVDNTAPSNPTVFSNLDGVTNLDVRSNLVLNFSESVTRGTGKSIRIVNDDPSGAVGGGFRGEDTVHSFTIDVNDTDQVIITNGGVVKINPTFDFDLSNNYHIEIDAGAFIGVTSNLPSAAISDNTSLNFSTVTPGVSTSNTAVAVQAVQMADSGALQNSLKWLDISGAGSASVLQNINAGSDAIAFVVKDADNRATGDGDIIISEATEVNLQSFGGNDLLYIDTEVNNVLAYDDVSFFAFVGGTASASGGTSAPYKFQANPGVVGNSRFFFNIDASVMLNPLNSSLNEVLLNNNNPWSNTGIVITG